MGGKYNQCYDAAVHNCKNIRRNVKTGSKKHSSLRPSKLQLHNEAALISCRIRAVEHRKCVAGPAGLQDRILQNYARIENTHEVRKKTFNFLLCTDVQQILVFIFPCWDIINFLNASMFQKALFELVQQFYHATENANVATAVSACADQP